MAESGSDREKKIGPTKLAKVIALTVEHKKKSHLDLNEKNRPIGLTAKSFSSYLGTVARNRLDITINE